MNSLRDLWERVCNYCSGSMQSVAFNTWIAPLTPVSLRDRQIKIKAPSAFQKNIVETNYMTMLTDAFEEIFGFEMEVIIISDDMPEGDDPIKKVQQQQNENVLSTYTFENFIVGESNRLAYSIAKAVAKAPGTSYNPLFIYGNSGLGKTHLLNAIYNEIKKTNPSLNLVFTSAENFTNELIGAIMSKENMDFREKYRTTDVLFIDDIHFLATKENAQEEFFNTFNSLYLNDKQIVVTSDRPPKEIQLLNDRLRTRFEQGLVTDIQKPDYETRVAIIQHKSHSLGLELSNEIVNYIAEQLKSNVRQLEGVVKKLDAYSTLTGENINMTIVVNSINDIKSNDQPTPVTIGKIIDNVEHYFNLSVGSLASSRQTKDISQARQVAIYICRDMTDATLEELGNEFKRDHSSISYALVQFENKLKKNPSYRSVVNEIIKNVNNN